MPRKQMEPMLPSARRALRSSIAHWKRMLAGKERPGEEPNGWWCSLCALFDKGDDCSACPVRQKIGHSGCWGSPYRSAHKAYYARGSGNPDAERAWKTAAKCQVAFLESLLPRKESKTCRAKK
jgi:hypothetical protein